MTSYYLSFLVLFGPFPIFAFEPAIPASVVVRLGGLLRLDAKTGDQPVDLRSWEIPIEIPAGDFGFACDNKTLFAVVPNRPCKLEVRIATLVDGKPIIVKTIVTVQGEGPPPPPPPADELEHELQAIFLADTDPSKKEVVGKLALLYKTMKAECDDPEIGSVGALASIAANSGNRIVGPGLRAFRARVGKELASILGAENPEREFTPDLRAKASKFFGKLQSICESLAK